MRRGNKLIGLLVLCYCLFTPLVAQRGAALPAAERPMIWVRAEERPAILRKIAEHPAVAEYFEGFKERVKRDMSDWATAPSAYLKRLPLVNDPDGAFPPFKTYLGFGGKDRLEQEVMMHLLQTAVDGGVLYFLTQEPQYARYAADVLHTFVHALRQMPLSTEHYNAGWVYRKDHLREAREIGAQLPIIYDFIYTWLRQDGRVYDLQKGGAVAFDFTAAEEVFRTYAELAINRGGTGHNWPILESFSLVSNALALGEPAERAEYLKYFLRKDTDRQDALPTIAAFYEKHGGSWPESFGYSQHVGEFLIYQFALLSHYDPTMKLVDKYPQIMAALPEAYYFTYPGGKETILHGDGHRKYHPLLNGYEVAYHLAQRENRPELLQSFGSLINHSVATAGYERFAPPAPRTYPASPYRAPLKLLWFAPTIEVAAGDYPLPVTNELPFAGITLQRNLSPSGKAEDGLMGFVGGGAYVHGHATGMSMELFGKGFVLGGKGGRSQYGTDVHENYYRLFASNNTVIVNGATTAADGWVQLGTDRVKRLAAEPVPWAEPLSRQRSFMTSAFRDTVGTGAEAYQERTLGIVRTSDTTGYYVDVFRSHSELPQQYHDYIYRNVGDSLRLQSADGGISLRPTPNRFRANAKGEWQRNRVYRQPGWHFFENVHTSAKRKDGVQAVFESERLGAQLIAMHCYYVDAPEREYTAATSPPMPEGPEAYRDQRAPTLIIRQYGSAWARPFAAVYEPTAGRQKSVASVGGIWRGRRCEGLEVRQSTSAGGGKQLILTPTDTTALVDYANGIRFKGRYAVIDFDGNGELLSAYVGRGQRLEIDGMVFRPGEGFPLAVHVSFRGAQPEIRSYFPLHYTNAEGTERYISGRD